MFDDIFSAVSDLFSGPASSAVGDVAGSAAGAAVVPPLDLSMTDLGGITGGFSGSVDPTAAASSLGAQVGAAAPDIFDAGLSAAPLDIFGTGATGAVSAAPTGASSAPLATLPTVSAPVASAAPATTGGPGLSAAGATTGPNPSDAAANIGNRIGSSVDLAGTPSSGDLFGKGGFLAKNANWLIPSTLGAGGLLMQQLSSGLPPQSKATVAPNEALINQGQSLIGAATDPSKIPAGAVAGLQQQLDQRIADIKSQYAARGMSGSTSEVEDVNAARASFEAQKADLGQKLAQIGANEIALGSGQLNAVAQTQLSLDQELQQALAEFGLAAGIGASKSSA